MMTRRLLAALASLSITAGMLVGAATPAHAAAVSLDCEYDSQSISVQVSETLTITANYCYVDGVSGVGTFAQSEGLITEPVTFTSPEAGTATLTISSGQGSEFASVLTITVGGSASTDPASVYPTAYLNANGGTCTGTLQFTKYAGLNGTITLPTAARCTRAGYELENWT